MPHAEGKPIFHPQAEAPVRPWISAVGRAELVCSLLAVVAVLYLLPAAKHWLLAEAQAVQTSALGDCRLPQEHEQLHLVVINRGGKLVAGGCLFVGSQGTYPGARR